MARIEIIRGKWMTIKPRESPEEKLDAVRLLGGACRGHLEKRRKINEINPNAKFEDHFLLTIR